MAIIRRDEILEKVLAEDASAIPRYNLRRPDGTLIEENVTLELANTIAQNGTPVNAAALNEMLAASGVTGGTSTAYTLAQDGFYLFAGAFVRFGLHTASGDNPTLNINGTGAKRLLDPYGKPIYSGMPAGTWVEAVYSDLMDAYVTASVPRYDPTYSPIDLIANITPVSTFAVDIPLPAQYSRFSVDVIENYTYNTNRGWTVSLDTPVYTTCYTHALVSVYDDNGASFQNSNQSNEQKYGAIGFMGTLDGAPYINGDYGVTAHADIEYFSAKRCVVGSCVSAVKYTAGPYIQKQYNAVYTADSAIGRTLKLSFTGSALTAPNNNFNMVVKGYK